MQNYKPLYLWSLEEAIRNNEKDLWRESYKENCDCARTIEKAIMKMQRNLKEISLCAMKTALPRRRNCHMAYMW